MGLTEVPKVTTKSGSASQELGPTAISLRDYRMCSIGHNSGAG